VKLLLRCVILFSTLFILQTSVQADPLDLVLTQGVSSALPIAIVPFTGQDNINADNNISSVITADLKNSGQFNVTEQRTAKVDDVVTGSVKALGGDKYQVNFSLTDITDAVLASNNFTVSGDQLRALGHHISDVIYQQLTGVRGIFSTKIAYVLVQRSVNAPAKFALEIADADGYNPRTMLTSNQPIMSPAWSHDGKKIAYVSFEKTMPQIFVQDVASGDRHAISNFPGVNGAPAWSPDDSQLALVLSKDGGNPQIYLLGVNGGLPQQMTHDNAINTEPSFSPDGKTLIFTSDRGGGPQIYQMNVAGGDIQRLTFKGGYNARASFAADGQNIVMINRQGSGYNIALQNLTAGTLLVLTHSGNDASPSFAPNGKMVLFETDFGGNSGQGVLGMVSADGRVKLRLPAPNGSVQDPAWSPFL
jgi:TolB protein